ncbi:MAG: DegQ family serine endoprotease [Verrucomicrobiales bacterium]
MKRTIINLTCIGIGGLLALLTVQFLPSYAKDQKALPNITVQDTPVERNGKFTTSFAPVIKKAAPSVVNIFTTKMVKEPSRDGRFNPLFNDPLFRQFFGEPDTQRRPRNRKEQSLGSGVIVSSDGYIMTSNHVVEGADEIRIVMTSGAEYTAKMVGNDPATDSALLKVEATGLPAITLANSDNLEVGDIVLAIGNPFGIGQTVTMGIVSATGRGELGIVDYEDFIQTDASINPGNSGGALIDAEGRLIGINTAILSRSGGNQGVGFAIPVNMGRHVMERLIVDGRVTRGFLGVGIQAVTPEIAREFDLPDTSGALVNGLEETSPAAKAGIQPGDVIIEFNGKKVQDNRHLRLMVSQTAPNTEAKVKAVRNKETKNFTVKLAELNPEKLASMRSGGLVPSTPETQETLAGVEVGDVDAKTRRQFGIPAHVRGALVTNVDQDSAAFEAGLRPGFVILEIDRKAVTNADQAVELTNQHKGDKVFLRVWANGSAQYIFVEKAKKDGASSDKNKNDDEEPEEE